jgi:iron complex transport system permease protein
MSGMTQALPATPARTGPAWWRSADSSLALFAILIAALAIAAIVAATAGAAGIPLSRIPAALGLSNGDAGPAMLARDQLVLWSVRLPRIAIAMLIGALLAASGAVMQGLFRNPLADPALVGASSGGALGAAAAIVLADRMSASLASHFELLPVAAFLGSLATTWALYRIATSRDRTSIAVFLLGGIAVAALANAGIGLLVFVADDRQLRDITFWLLGSLSGATWDKAALVAPFAAAFALATPLVARGLDLLVLGEAEAFHMGIRVERLKRLTIVIVAALTGIAVSLSGIVGFVGIVVPHLLRLVIGPGHRRLLPASMALGAILLLVADTFARTLAAPAEVPIGVLTALIGAPFFLAILLRQRGLTGL